MAKEELKYSIQAIGKVVRHFRKSKKMSPSAFGVELDKAPIVIDIVEHADSEAGAELCKLLPAHELNDLVVCLEEVFGQPFDELYAAAEQADEPQGMPGEVTLCIPVTISVEQVMDVIDQLLLLSAQEDGTERQRVLRDGFLTAGVLAQLQGAYHRQQGRAEEGRACLAHFMELLEARK